MQHFDEKISILINICPVFSFSQYTVIPDENFEQALIDLGYDDINDGKVLTENINTVDSLKIHSRVIKDLTGIEAFTFKKFVLFL